MKVIKGFWWIGGFLILGAIVLVLSLGGEQAVAGISGSEHDFSTANWSGGQICVVCHTPHGGDTTVVDAPLWNHALTTKTFQLYTSPTLNATVSQPDGASKLCLSCHDGTVAVDSFGGATGTQLMTGGAAVGVGPKDLTDDHPISFIYNTALATADGGLFDPASRTVIIGSGSKTKTGTINDVMLYNGKLQCSSCHDVHNNFVAGTGALLRITTAGSALCLACHDK